VQERRTGSPESPARRKRSLSVMSSGKQAFGTPAFCVLCATQERRIQRFSRLSSSRSASATHPGPQSAPELTGPVNSRIIPHSEAGQQRTEGCRRKQRTLARISSGLRIPFTRHPSASDSLFKLDRKNCKVVQDEEPVAFPAAIPNGPAGRRSGHGLDESAAGYPWAGCSPAEPVSARPVVTHAPGSGGWRQPPPGGGWGTFGR
jgi:hypothetical protein